MEIFDIIKTLCDEQNVKITVLERDLNFSRGSIYKMAESSPSADKVKKLADYFNVSTDYLLGRTNNKEGFNTNSVEKISYDSILRIYMNAKSKLSKEDKLNLAQKILSDVNGL